MRGEGETPEAKVRTPENEMAPSEGSKSLLQQEGCPEEHGVQTIAVPH